MEIIGKDERIMASLPSDRTKLALAQSNQNPGIAAGSAQNKNAITEAYDTIDLLNQKVDSLVGSSTLSPYPPAQYNKLINGGFAVNQRAVSGTVTLAAGAYGHDRWKAGAAGCTYTFSTTNNVTTITITAGSLIQVIEGISLYSGTHTLSWSGTSQGKIGAGSFGVSGVNSSVVGGTNLSIEFNVGTLSNVQFNFGSISIPFQPRSFAEELALCKRYYQKSFPYTTAPIQNVGNSLGALESPQIVAASTAQYSVFGYLRFPVAMRITPTVTTYNPNVANNQIRNTGTASDCPANVADACDQGFRIDTTTPAGSASGQLLIVHYSADAEI